MQLISQRIALGLDVKPTKIQNRKRNRSQTLNSLDTLTGETNRPGHKQSQSDDKSVDWKKWSDRVAFGKSLATDGKRLLTNQRVSECLQLSRLWSLIIIPSFLRAIYGLLVIR